MLGYRSSILNFAFDSVTAADMQAEVGIADQSINACVPTLGLVHSIQTSWHKLHTAVSLLSRNLRCSRAEKVLLPSQGLREMDMHYFGGGVEFTQALGRATHGGQVVLSESAWASIQDQLPGSSQVPLRSCLSPANPAQEVRIRGGGGETSKYPHFFVGTLQPA